MNSICACAIAFLSVMLLAGPGLARERPNAATLELTLEIGKPALVLGEAVYATVRLVNAGVMPMDVSKLLDPQTGALQLEVSSSRRPRFVFLPLFYSDAVHARTPLAPDEEVAAAFPIFYGALGWTFDQPGTYRVTAEYRPQGVAHSGRVRSTTVTVTVTVADEGGIGTLLMTGTTASEEAAKFLLWQTRGPITSGTRIADRPAQDLSRLAGGRLCAAGVQKKFEPEFSQLCHRADRPGRLRAGVELFPESAVRSAAGLFADSARLG